MKGKLTLMAPWITKPFGDDGGLRFGVLPTLPCDPKYSRNILFTLYNIAEVKLE